MYFHLHNSYIRNHLLLFYGKEYLKEEDADNKKIDAITWLEKLLSDPTNELHQRIFYISSWSNSPEVEISLGLDERSSHKYSFYEIIDGFKNNQELLDNLSEIPEIEIPVKFYYNEYLVMIFHII